MNHRFNKRWQRKNDENFSLGILPFFILILIAFGFKSIAPNEHQANYERINIELPRGERFQKLINTKPLLHLYVGFPKNLYRSHYYGTRFQINDKIAGVNDISYAAILTNDKWFLGNEKCPIRAEIHADKTSKWD